MCSHAHGRVCVRLSHRSPVTVTTLALSSPLPLGCLDKGNSDAHPSGLTANLQANTHEGRVSSLLAVAHACIKEMIFCVMVGNESVQMSGPGVSCAFSLLFRS